MTSLSAIWRSPGVVSKYKTGVSLHSHTQHSKELLDFLPRYTSRVPFLPGIVRHYERRYSRLNPGSALNWSNAWWTPPLSANAAYALESAQIADQLGLTPMVSITDHDSIQAPMRLRVLDGMQHVPISLEWTVPFGASYFHLGVHNLPARWASHVMERLEFYTAGPKEARLPDFLSILHGFPSVLVVLNHPLWDEHEIGGDTHHNLLLRFLRANRQWIHALEWNGLRPFGENRAAWRLAQEHGLPVISGGDRHGCEANSAINLTNAADFSEFVSEIRQDRRSCMLFLQQSREPLRLRLLQGVGDVLRDYADFPEDRRLWTDRIFYQSQDSSVRPLSALWPDGEPSVVKLFRASVRLLECNRVKNVLRTAFTQEQEVSTL